MLSFKCCNTCFKCCNLFIIYRLQYILSYIYSRPIGG
nr:MAG TPA: Endoplasmic reticulum vesicle transporter [Caudoviricetes sp.]